MLWVDVVGYQHERVHTGALHTLLNFGDSPTNPVRVAVAQGLTGDRSVVGVDWAEHQQRLVPGRPRRVLDLAGELLLANGSTRQPRGVGSWWT